MNPATGEVSKIYLLVGVLPFSQKAYFEPTLDMRGRTWLRCHAHMHEFWGGAPERRLRQPEDGWSGARARARSCSTTPTRLSASAI